MIATEATDVSRDTTNSPVCFVVMPIREAGTDEHSHYLSIYEILAERVGVCGFTVIRADRTNLPGNITKEIIQKLAEADLVIADLTDLNPNVFYELGVRHALRRAGTVLLIDKLKTPTIPFDVSQYRVMEYEGNLPGVVQLGKTVGDLVRQLTGTEEWQSLACDSPVHDWYPALAPNLISIRQDEDLDGLAQEVVILRRELEVYKSRSTAGASAAGIASPIGANAESVVLQLSQAVSSGGLSTMCLSKAGSAVQTGDTAAFLDAVKRFLEARDNPTGRSFLILSSYAQQLGFNGLSIALLEEATRRYPEDGDLRKFLHLHMSRSAGEDRKRAKKYFASQIGVDPDTGETSAEAPPPARTKGASRDRDNSIGFLLEILHSEGQDELALRILDNYGTSTGRSLRRERARLLEWLGRPDEAFEVYRAALNAELEQESFRWFGNFLHNHGWHVEAAELFLLEAFYDLQDPNGSLHVADELSFHLFDYFSLKTVDTIQSRPPRDLPESIDVNAIEKAAVMALSTGTLNPEQSSTLERLSRRAGLDLEQLAVHPHVSKQQYLAWMVDFYKKLRSDLTDGTIVGNKLLMASPE